MTDSWTTKEQVEYYKVFRKGLLCYCKLRVSAHNYHPQHVQVHTSYSLQCDSLTFRKDHYILKEYDFFEALT